MKLLEREGERLVFRMSAREKVLLERVLGFFPLRPEAQPGRLSKEADPRMDDADQLLMESLRDQKSDLTTWIQHRLCEGEAFQVSGAGWRLVLDGADVERLLQVLNELRVSAWVKLGRPDQLDAAAEETASVAHAPLHALMVLTGQFEMILVHAMMRDPGDPGPSTSGAT